VSDIPLILQFRLSFYLKHFSFAERFSALQTLILTSDYACRHINILKQLIQDKTWQTTFSLQDFKQQLDDLCKQFPNGFASALRHFRHYHLLRLLLKELAGFASTSECMLEWSDCADAIILKTLWFCERDLLNLYGFPCDEKGITAKFYTLALGKLGGRELNYSSDIDLIFAFSAAGYTNGKEKISNQQYYTKMVQAFIHLLQNNTAEGFVFRVDLRLRPNGESGALVSSLAAMETYYQEQGRDWERYAMIKARLIGECDFQSNHWFHRLITPFVYHRYVDFSVIESLRSMKSLIEREIQLNPMLDDIKRGFGGIREVEFIIQSIQLIRGGRLPRIRQQNTILALETLKQHHLLSHTSALKQAYLFLRKLENILQSQNDQQTHALPKDETKQAQIVLAMDLSSWENLLIKLQQYQRIIASLFRAVLSKPDPYEDQKRLLANQLASLWQGHVETTMAVNLLTSLGFKQAEHCHQMLHAFRHAPRLRRLPQIARLRLDRFMPLLLSELTHITDTENVLLNVVKLLENIVGRSSYLALITENPPVLKELLHWFEHSPFIMSLLVNHPFLLEVLLDQEQNWHLPSRKQLQQTLAYQLSNSSESEQQNEILRQFKLTNWLLAARAELYGRYHAIRISVFLANVAEVIVNEVFNLASDQLSQRYSQMTAIKNRFTVVAYGKLGGREMNYNSDLDLVFIHSTRAEDEALVMRLTQKILHMLTTRSQSGVLYAVDTRLRPSGAAGLLISSVDAFIDYQLHHAWVWEHQALVRARVIVGSRGVIQRFKQLKHDVLLTSREHSFICNEVLTMRAKIQKRSGGDPIKYSPGGLVDIEFLIQFLILLHGSENLLCSTNSLTLLKKIYAEKVLSKIQFMELKAAYKHYHHLLHQGLLSPPAPHAESMQRKVLQICQEIYNLCDHKFN
jgi:glutamate-ammonia-ligase adenylyltransferase